MEKNMENEMETGITEYFIGVIQAVQASCCSTPPMEPYIKPLCTTVGVQGNEPSKLKAKFGSLSSKSTASSCLIFAVSTRFLKIIIDVCYQQS